MMEKSHLDRKYKLKEMCRRVEYHLEKTERKCSTSETKLIQQACRELRKEMAGHDFEKDMVGATKSSVMSIRTLMEAGLKPVLIVGFLLGMRYCAHILEERMKLKTERGDSDG